MNTQSATERENRIRLLWAGFAFLYVASALLLKGIAPTPDEIMHYVQIDWFDHGNFRVADRYLTMIPGYHVVVAAALWLIDQRSLPAARLFNALVGLMTIGAFNLVRRRLWPDDHVLPTLQFALLPILVPYDFLVYTDVLSLGLVLAAGAATVRGRHVLSGALMIAAMGIRQTNVVVLPLFAGLAIAPVWERKPPPLIEIAERIWPYAIGVGAFLSYWLWNGHISLSAEQATMHPDFSVHIGNVYFTLFLCALFLPLQVIAGLREFTQSVRARPWLVAFPLIAIALFALIFRVDHPFNTATQPLFLHNYVIQVAASNVYCRILFAVIATLAACGLVSTSLRPAGAVLLYPVSVVALCAFWLVEHRYALIPIALWLAFRESRARKIEWATAALWLFFAVCFCLGIYEGAFNL